MTPVSNVSFRARCAIVGDGDAVVLSDLHYGYSASPDGTGGVQTEYDQLSRRVDAIAREIRPDTLVLNGDLFHRFETIPAGARESLQKLTRTVTAGGTQIVAVIGNHDVISPAVFQHVTAVDEWCFDDYDICCSHGHTPPTSDAQLHIVGHLHPMLRVQGSKWPCFLYGDGTYESSDVLVLPPFSEAAAGTAVHAGFSPSVSLPVVTDGAPLASYKPIIWDAETATERVFPPLNRIETVT